MVPRGPENDQFTRKFGQSKRTFEIACKQRGDKLLNTAYIPLYTTEENPKPRGLPEKPGFFVGPTFS